MNLANSASRTLLRSLSAAAAAFVIATVAGTAHGQPLYNSIPNPLPPSVASEGPEAYAFSEIGDGFTLAGPAGSMLGKITVIMDSWGCQTGRWNTADCVTTPGATFSQPLTINVYSVTGGPGTWAPLAKLASLTQTFDIPYRPSFDPVNCPLPGPDGPNDGEWFSTVDNSCHHGIAAPIAIDFSGFQLTLPPQIIVTVSYNTSTAGPSPIGTGAPCYSSSGGCPYDSLNVSTDTMTGTYNFIGAPLDPNSIFFNYISPANTCSGHGPTGVLALDLGCWAGYHPEIRVDPAQTTLDGAFQVRYAANLALGESYVDIINDGYNGAPALGPGFGPQTGTMCVNVYFVDPGEELVSCCSCTVTADQTVELGVKQNLTNNGKGTTNGMLPASVTVKLIGELGSCPTNAPASLTTPTGGFLAFGTTLHQTSTSGAYATTETAFTNASLSPSELASLVGRCSEIVGNDSTFGICLGCTPGALGAAKK